MSWNCHGLRSTLTVPRIKEIFCKISPDIMFLMETKNDDEFIKEKLQSLQYPNYFSVPPVGRSGGLSLMWKEEVDVKILEHSCNLIDTEVNFKGVSSFISFIYGPPALEYRSAFWNKLSDVEKGQDSSWLVTGDFNEILDNTEKTGGPSRWEGSFTPFRSFVSQNGL